MANRSFVAISDIHAGTSLTKWRRNCLPDILAKVEYVVDQCEMNDHLIIAGDLFNSYEASHSTVAALHGVLSKSKPCPGSPRGRSYTNHVLGVTGQHDLPKHGDWKRGPVYPLSWEFAHEAIRGVPQLHLTVFEDDGFTVGFAPFGTTEFDDGLCQQLDLLIMHDMLVPSSVPWTHTLLDDFARMFDDSKERVIVCGDNHTGYPPTKIGTTWFVNPGALTRTQRSDNPRTPQYARIQYTDDGVQIEYHEIPHLPADEVFDMTGYGGERIEATPEISEFVQQLKQTDADLTAIDFDKLDTADPDIVAVVREANDKARKELGYE